ncbi:MAG: hypothetical protein SNJ84_09080, partial [Verrucomicrobiia bacterium]
SQAVGAFLRVSVVWLGSREVLATGSDRAPRVVLGETRILREDETNEGVRLARSDRVRPRSIDAVLSLAPVRVDEGAEVAFDLANVPEAGVFRAEVSGPEVGEALEVWVNGHGPLSVVPTIPSLDDPGILQKGDRWEYAGWRPIALFIPGTWFSAGENMVIVQRGQTGGELPPLVLKDIRLELTRLSGPDLLPAPSILEEPQLQLPEP